jgi:hypothetical protein
LIIIVKIHYMLRSKLAVSTGNAVESVSEWLLQWAYDEAPLFIINVRKEGLPHPSEPQASFVWSASSSVAYPREVSGITVSNTLGGVAVLSACDCEIV